MKFKTTQKAIKEGYKNVIQVGYCDLQYLLYCQNPIAYTCGVYGWGADVYHINNSTAIVTGYRPFGNVEPDYKLIREYNQKAENIIHSKQYAIIREQLIDLIEDFVEKAIKEEGKQNAR